MTSRVIPVDPFTLVVFGGSGDLSRRKILPALFHRDAAGQLPPETRIIGVSRRSVSRPDFQTFARAALTDHVAEANRDPAVVERFLERLDYLSADAREDGGWDELAHRLEERDDIKVFYLATTPELFAPVAERLGAHGLAGRNSRIVLEKPIGKNFASALAVNAAIGKVFPEEAIYRIDHYLGKETVQNLMALRFANALFEPLWTAAHIDNVQITVSEELGVEGRAGYYDTAGAMRDMVQNHILQLLCLVAMEAPTSLAADSLRDEKLKVLKSLKRIDGSNAAQATVRGQYRAGASAGGAVTGYLDELGAPSNTETFVAIRAEIGNWRWAGVPFYLRTGKRLPARVSEIVVQFRAVPHSVFEQPPEPNRLVIRLQPDEGVKLWLMIKDPGPGGMRLQHVPLDMSFAESFNTRNPDAYERLILDVVRGNQTLFMRRDEVEAAWTWVDPIIEAWAASSEPPKPYVAGTWGPAAAVALTERDGRSWSDAS
ncbi:glucose-6-phosphate dehydrogenase [Lichenihabitans sp. Uapishka_5]|uniref:glucose-6-phosphate dehydrogenase n=1 Tax=Lichenihabitans sp. Uapishka_5 TaxID=3037302 RepID=UPI0029E81EB5|nr:glucose-6-phosphate dehydrogenase [Lichenihabitans sp. Uapishka_5]MDX7953072.1 glucose-6-phosphate dehydrogenase [Lichenihabitans sp. Uapishka_5]